MLIASCGRDAAPTGGTPSPLEARATLHARRLSSAPRGVRGPIVYWSETRAEPRPLRLHVARVDLADRRLSLSLLAQADPDGEGPAESELALPERLFDAAPEARLAINASAFAFTSEDGGHDFEPHRPVDVLGAARAGGRVVSLLDAPEDGLSVDADGRARIGPLEEARDAPLALSTFQMTLLRDGRVLPPEDFVRLHPRTLLGLDASGRWLTLVVVEGRKPGRSEGLTPGESAALMRELGCDDAINLDGGGSSVMLVRREDGSTERVDEVSGAAPRAVPVLLAVGLR